MTLQDFRSAHKNNYYYLFVAL